MKASRSDRGRRMPIRDRIRGEEEGGHGAHPGPGEGITLLGDQRQDPLLQLPPPLLQRLEDRRVLLQIGQRRRSRPPWPGDSRRGSRPGRPARRGRPAHEILPAPVGPNRQPAADDLPQGGEVGHDPEALLGAAQRHPEPGHDLVEDEDGALFGAEGPEPLQEPLHRRDAPHVPGHRLHDDAGDLAWIGIEEGLDRGQVVVVGHQGVLGGPGVTPGLEGTPSVAAPDPASTRKASAWPW